MGGPVLVGSHRGAREIKSYVGRNSGMDKRSVLDTTLNLEEK